MEGQLLSVHGAFEARVDVPRVGSVESVLQLGLACDEGFHLVGILEHRGEGIPWKGNYSSWLEQKTKRLEQEEKQASKRRKTLEQQHVGLL